MTKHPLLLAALAATTLTAGCGTPNRGLDSVHQPVVSRSDYAFDVRTGDDGLMPGERERLAGWLDTLRLGYGDTVAVDDPNGGGVPAREAVAGVAAHYGLLLSEQAPVTGAPVAPGTIRVVVSRTRAAVPGCPDYSRPSQPDFNVHTASNYGCAVNANLAAMVANPTDLVRGTANASGAYDTRAATRAIATMRDAKPTGEGGNWLKNKTESGGTGGK